MSHHRLVKFGLLLGGLLLISASAWLVPKFTGERRTPELEVRAIAHQWWWEFDYPSLGVKVKNELHLPEGQPVRLELISADVLHSFWLPAMKMAVDVVPGQKRTLLLTSRNTGTLHGSCGVGCGCNTVCMRFRVLVSNYLEFAKWIKKQRGVSLTPGNRTAPSCVLNHAVNGVRSSAAVSRLAVLLNDGNDGGKRAPSSSSAP
jgi:heme/copper-type cytochrome/quinol oxidase subunit 2